jgi:hypothetical protein
LKIVIRERGPFLLQLAFGDVPVAFDFKCIHNGSFYFGGLLLSAANVTAKVNDIIGTAARAGEVAGNRFNGAIEPQRR